MSLWHSPHFRSGKVCSTSLSMDYLHKLFGILPHVRFVSSPFMYSSFISTHSYLFVLLLALFQLWPLRAFSVGSYVHLTYPHECVCVLKTSIFYDTARCSWFILQEQDVLETAISPRSSCSFCRSGLIVDGFSPQFYAFSV